jgi:protein O-GlcNAc transferase
VILNNLGIAYFRLRDYPNAEKSYRKSLELNPDRPETHNNLGSLYLEQDDFSRAIPYFREALKIKPDFREAALNLQMAESRLKE